eukprot:5807782-Pyramimonas_sp.AAC.2
MRGFLRRHRRQNDDAKRNGHCARGRVQKSPHDLQNHDVMALRCADGADGFAARRERAQCNGANGGGGGRHGREGGKLEKEEEGDKE